MRRAHIHNTVPGSRVPRTRLGKLAEIVLKGESRRQDVNIVFIEDDEMKQINHKFRNKESTTDVLSFALEEEDDPLIGEIYISIPEARRNAAEQGHSYNHEILKLTAHGLLHLCGIHHPTAQKREVMAAKEEEYLAQLKRFESRC
jgi:probable rRNA maturation factor